MDGAYTLILYDVGNTNIHRYEKGSIRRISPEEFKTHEFPHETFYYISVNKALDERFVLSRFALNLEPFFNLDTVYEGLGVDRIAACKGARDGIVVDAGSAITIDIMSNSIHLGGYILPGFASYTRAFASISPALDMVINPNTQIDSFPQTTKDAMSQGVIKPILVFLESIQHGKRIYFTGGDGMFLSKFFKSSIHDNSLIFKGMLQTIKEQKL